MISVFEMPDIFSDRRVCDVKEYQIIRQTTWIFKVKAASEEEAMAVANKTWDDDLRLSADVIYHESTDDVINRDPLPSIYESLGGKPPDGA